MSEPHIAFSIASYHGMEADTAVCLAAMARLTPCAISINVRQQRPYTHWNREDLVADARDDGATHMLFIDTDLIFPADAAVRLLAHGVDVIGANYHMKIEAPVPISTIKLNDNEGGGVALIGKPPETPSFKCAAIPTGLMLIDMTVFDRLDQPYFPCEMPVGEDIAFCRKVRDAGMDVWCDQTIAVGHIGRKVY